VATELDGGVDVASDETSGSELDGGVDVASDETSGSELDPPQEIIIAANIMPPRILRFVFLTLGLWNRIKTLR